jgi:ABC-type transport system involved in multi-copper enzyme maturation permease subunit
MAGKSASLSELAKGASQTFAWASIAQLLLMCFLAPVFTASAITQEKDAQTFNILLSTPLSNAQIVFGSLMSRLYFVVMLLVAGVMKLVRAAEGLNARS